MAPQRIFCPILLKIFCVYNQPKKVVSSFFFQTEVMTRVSTVRNFMQKIVKVRARVDVTDLLSFYVGKGNLAFSLVDAIIKEAIVPPFCDVMVGWQTEVHASYRIPLIAK